MMALRELSVQDIPLGMAFKKMAGWNQLPADWEILLSLSQGGSYLATWQGKPAGTVTTIQYPGPFSWIGMVLVDPQYRGLGIGTGLLRAAIDYAQSTGPVLLDATPKGRKLYLTLGFSDICPLERLEADRLAIPSRANDPHIIPIRPDLLAACIEYDRLHFGARRDGLLRALWSNAPDYGWACLQDGKVKGYCLGRPGSRFDQIGPVVADDTVTARALLLAAARNIPGKPVIVDIMSEQIRWRSWLLELGFTVQRPFTRMSLGEWAAQRDRSGQFAIAGPEFG
ncbi:GNAT family N-acetyltransferase [Flavilitoribacter nigricans]|uniref:N-acetyltransferase domain-containing protein n=1 Tax=Flavilitoribacter nigricans (strain ATCC 23147 / DSM 23189 / NBRC 102662 / NCIMB 1420 / SS-2) TaxID=1122177 RepID=A0A2D0NEL2_FLAN2|nr:GNAT family N-acetyltransferase [Flavilitoribacter nigricans]PHN06619.1 hypothetical protein CRP01_09980 [Flavilitoribacter nigricans DSM 23189 = NBRC 102662]